MELDQTAANKRSGFLQTAAAQPNKISQMITRADCATPGHNFLPPNNLLESTLRP